MPCTNISLAALSEISMLFISNATEGFGQYLLWEHAQGPAQGHNTKTLLDSRWRINNRGLSTAVFLVEVVFITFGFVQSNSPLSPHPEHVLPFFFPSLGKGYCYLFLFSFLISLTSTRFSLQPVSFSAAQINADFISMKSCVDTDLSFA